MSEPHTRIGHLAARLRGGLARPRPRHWAALGAVGVAAIGLVSLRAIDLPAPRPLEAHNRLRIEVVAPVEPKIEPGSRMDVGDLVNGFRYSPPPRAVAEPIAYEDDRGWEDRREDDWREPPPYAREPRRDEVAAYLPPRYARPEPDRRRGDRRQYGFDEPRRDWQAERDDRRARYEARAEVRDRRWEDRESEWRSRTYRDDRPRREPPPYDRWN